MGASQPRRDLVRLRGAAGSAGDPGGLWLTSYAKNKAYLEEVDAKVPMLEQQSKALQNQPQRDLFALLPLLNSPVDLPKSDAFDVNDPPVSRRMGLYRGDDVSDASQSLYQKALDQMLLPAVAMHITTAAQRQRQRRGIQL